MEVVPLINKEEQYMALYFPEDMLEEKTKAYNLLLDIDCNFSRLIQQLLPEIIRVAGDIEALEESFRDYEWQLCVKKKGTKRGNKKKNQEEKDGKA